MVPTAKNGWNVYSGALTLAIIFLSNLHRGYAEVPTSAYPLINKCCNLTQFYNTTKNQCEDIESSSDSTIWSILSHFSETGEAFNVTFNPQRPPSCSKDISISMARSNDPTGNTTRFFLDKTGTLRETTYYDENNTLHQMHHSAHHYCIDVLGDAVVVQVCPASCDDKEPCYRQCCPHGQYVHPQSYECVSPESSTTSPGHFPIFNHSDHPSNSRNKESARVTIGHTFLHLSDPTSPCSPISTGLKNVVNIPFKILTNGSPVAFDQKKNVWSPLKEIVGYCVDSPPVLEEEKLCEGEHHVLYVCQRETSENETMDGPQTDMDFEWLGTVAKVTLITAIVCLFLTVVTVFLVMDKANLPSWTRLSFVTSEFILLFLFSLIYSERFQNPYLYPASCKAYAIIFHYTGLMTVCWLSVMNFDLWWTFKVLKPSKSNKFDVRRFLCYVCFAVGVPLLIVLIAIVIQSLKPEISKILVDFSSHLESRVSDYPHLVCHEDVPEQIKVQSEVLSSKLIYPDYGETYCGLSERSLGAYWYGPLCFLLFANLVFFLATSSRMANLRRMTRRASIESTGGQRAQSMKIFMRIFIVSGVTWNIETIAWLLEVDGKYRLDIVHHFQAMALFYIFVCKKGVLRSLQRKYPISTIYIGCVEIIPERTMHHSRTQGGSLSTDFGSKSRKTSNVSTGSLVGSGIVRQGSVDLLAGPNGLTTLANKEDAINPLEVLNK